MNVSLKIFRQYDIRGIYGEDLDDVAAKLIGQSAGTFFLKNGIKSVVAGRDNRVSGKAVFENLITGLLMAGCEVVDIGLSLSPLTYFSWYSLDANASIMVTASHNPAKYNGFKISLNKKVLTPENYQEIFQICESNSFSSGIGTRKFFDIWPSYKEKIKKDVSLGRKMKVVVDCGNGTAGTFAPDILRDLGCKVIPIFCESDGSFPNHDPYPQKKELYSKLVETIKSEKADIGIALDGDGDRLGIYDEGANFIENDRLAMIFAKNICSGNPGSKIVLNITTSMAVLEYIKSVGGEPLLWKTGFPNISEKMREIDAIFGGEISGHFFFRDRYFGYDDALYASFRILEIISNSKESLKEIVKALPKYFETREIRINVPANMDKFAIVNSISKEIKEEFKEAEIIDIDGIRFSFQDGWGLVRSSNTESVIGIRAEGKTEKRLSEIKNIIENKLKKFNLSIPW